MHEKICFLLGKFSAHYKPLRGLFQANGHLVHNKIYSQLIRINLTPNIQIMNYVHSIFIMFLFVFLWFFKVLLLFLLCCWANLLYIKAGPCSSYFYKAVGTGGRGSDSPHSFCRNMHKQTFSLKGPLIICCPLGFPNLTTALFYTNVGLLPVTDIYICQLAKPRFLHQRIKSRWEICRYRLGFFSCT